MSNCHWERVVPSPVNLKWGGGGTRRLNIVLMVHLWYPWRLKQVSTDDDSLFYVELFLTVIYSQQTGVFVNLFVYLSNVSKPVFSNIIANQFTESSSKETTTYYTYLLSIVPVDQYNSTRNAVDASTKHLNRNRE